MLDTTIQSIVQQQIDDLLWKENICYASVRFLSDGNISLRLNKNDIVIIEPFSARSIRHHNPRWIRYLRCTLRNALKHGRRQWIVETHHDIGTINTSMVQVQHVYHEGSLHGFSCFATKTEIEMFQNENQSVVINNLYQLDTKATVATSAEALSSLRTTTQRVGSFLQRIGKTSSSNALISPSVFTFVVDTGIASDHSDLPQIHPTLSRNFTSRNQAAWIDENGHGTHVAGIIGAVHNNFGILGTAPNANLVALRVLGRNGSGSYADVIAALQYVAQWKRQNPSSDAVVNLSLGGPAFQPLDTVIRQLIRQGIHVVVAAGNESRNANTTSPARVVEALTIGAYDIRTNQIASFSNFGQVVDILAPGTQIESTHLDNSYIPLSGTSMATPIVCGALVYLLSLPKYQKLTPEAMKRLLIDFATNPRTSTGEVASNPRIRLSRVAQQARTTNLGIFLGNA